MTNNIDNKDNNKLVANCDQSNMNVTKCDNHELAGNIEPLIKVIRGQQVMLDKDLATLYGVETKALNQTVKRNMERFPDDFRFELSREECLRSQIVTSNGRGGNRYSTYAFTEQGVAMLSSVLRSKTAIEVNIQIMRAFVSMRHFMANNASVFSRLETIEYHQLEILQHQQDTDKHLQESDKRIEEVFRRLDEGNAKPKQGVFYNGQIYDAYTFVSDLIKSAKKRIILIDNYVDETVLTLLDKRENDVSAVIYTQQISRQFQLDIDRHNAQYAPIDVETFRLSHDRFLCIDDNVYHIGASIKDLGKKWFGFSKMEILAPNELVERINRG
ncbi:ORF6N domain-containing protein [Bacteroides ovatus]|uniref:ORF6N domain-containing protein n=1 Tax=Bacteroides ovatus TaxID=28116 RepID=UPI0022A9FA78|nr:ORF6N domain-containing protein [Bacteroides ovatus]MCZ2716059.1 ORF6N domain-containing protein [Bacteroides ovatus]